MLGVFSAAFLAMYGLSAVQMAHNRVLRVTARTASAEVRLDQGLADARAAARMLMDRSDVRGDLTQIEMRGGRLHFRLTRPGITDDVDYDPVTGAAALRESRAGMLGMLNRLHHAAGVDHEYGPINVWGLFVRTESGRAVPDRPDRRDLWFELHAERRVGPIRRRSASPTRCHSSSRCRSPGRADPDARTTMSRRHGGSRNVGEPPRRTLGSGLFPAGRGRCGFDLPVRATSTPRHDSDGVLHIRDARDGPRDLANISLQPLLGHVAGQHDAPALTPDFDVARPGQQIEGIVEQIPTSLRSSARAAGLSAPPRPRVAPAP